ncbi:MAG: hypothetical protein Q6361_07005 [Candidatus Hermodarchaeota archaeon]|nr:hypothetical protein [Candidatus Hermodarchaeota archaeon]
MKHTLRSIHEDFVELKELVRSQGYTIEVDKKLDSFDKKLDSAKKELREINWAERADAIHWGHLEKLRNEFLGVGDGRGEK